MTNTLTEFPAFFAGHPVRVTFCFRSKDEMRAFMGGLIDGWGEDGADVNWPWRESTAAGGPMDAYSFTAFTARGVEPDSDEDGS